MSGFNIEMNTTIPHRAAGKAKPNTCIGLLVEIRQRRSLQRDQSFLFIRGFCTNTQKKVVHLKLQGLHYEHEESHIKTGRVTFITITAFHTNYVLMKSVCIIYNRGASASQSFVIWSFDDLTKQINSKQEEEGM